MLGGEFEPHPPPPIEVAPNKVAIRGTFCRKPSQSLDPIGSVPGDTILIAQVGSNISERSRLLQCSVGITDRATKFGHGYGALGSCKTGRSLSDLKRIAIKILEAAFVEPRGSILKTEAAHASKTPCTNDMPF